jgi:hypothetical protein
MKTRFAVGRCCCEAVPNQFTIGPSGMDVSSFFFRWWTPGGGEHDPITGINRLQPTFCYGTDFRDSQGFRFGRFTGIPVHTYTNITFQMWGFAVESDGTTPDTSDTPQDYEIYCWDHAGDAGSFASVFTVGIPRADLVGPIAWNESGNSWVGGALRTTPNLASICNPVINGASWDSDSVLHLLIDVLDQEASGTPPGRHLSPSNASNLATFQW